MTRGADPAAVVEGYLRAKDALREAPHECYENIRTFILADRPGPGALTFRCVWLVGMSDKTTRAARVGWGRYAWMLDQAPPHRACELLIDIEMMQVLAPECADPIFEWIERLPWPWVSPREVLAAAPALEALTPVLDALRTASGVEG